MIAVLAFTPAHGQAPGSRVVDFIGQLLDRGITIIYSSELVDESMLVLDRPEGGNDLERLDSILEPHALRLQAGPGQSWLIVRREESGPSSQRPSRIGRDSLPGIALPAMENIVVSASRYSMGSSTGPSTNALDHDEIIDSPSLGEDAVRAAHIVPGVTSNGLSARVNVRGGDTDEVLFELDGVPLFNPFHLKDFQSLFSGIDPRIVDSMTVYTSAYPAQFGNRMSGVMAMQSARAERSRLHEVGVSTLATSVLSSGLFADGRASWLTSARRGNLDLLVDAANSDIGTPQYFDVYTKLDYEVGPDLVVSGGFLSIDDKITLFDEDTASARARYRDRHLWFKSEYSSGRLDLDVLFSRAHSTARRTGSLDDAASSGFLDDDRGFDANSLETVLTYRLNERHWIQSGLELSDYEADYAFDARRTDNIIIDFGPLERTAALVDEALDLSQRQRGLFVRYRVRPSDAITTELGLRWDDQSVPSDSQFSPRISVLFDVLPRASFRASWGRHFQAQRADELQVNDGISTLFPAQEAEHAVVSFEYLIGNARTFRIEAYRKEFEALRPRFENVYARVSLLPELTGDRVRISPTHGEASGFELILEGRDGPWVWSASIARSRASDVLQAAGTRRSWDEPWSFKGYARWAGQRWTLGTTASWHSGWPTTGLSIEGERLVAGPFNAQRFRAFSTLDVRASRWIGLERGELELFVEVSNLLDRKNECCLEYSVELDDSNEPVALQLVRDDWMGIAPTVGLLWRLPATSP